MKQIVPNLWFDNQSEQAAKFYCSIFKNSKIHSIARYGKSGAKVSGQKEGSVMTVEFSLDGNRFIAINGGPVFKLSPAVSFMIECRDQKEIDYYWSKLIKGGQAQQCGWLTDKYGLSWQIVPKGLEKLLKQKDRAKAERMMAAFFQMVKIDVAKLEKAAKG